MAAQGYDLKTNIVFQDNASAILMECNGRNACTGNSRHIHIRYFFVTDRIAKGEFSVKHCPTLLMIADFFTKPLQGALFRKFRDIIMGYVPVLLPSSEDSLIPTSQERVGNPILDPVKCDMELSNESNDSSNKKDTKTVSFLPDTKTPSKPITRTREKPTYASILRKKK